MRFETKIAVIVRDDLETWHRLNVTAFLASGIAANPDLHGEPYRDADGTGYLPLFRTGYDEANRAVVAAVRGPDLDVVGVAVHGPRNAVDKIMKGAALHR
jgi:hypothetical protein